MDLFLETEIPNPAPLTSKLKETSFFACPTDLPEPRVLLDGLLVDLGAFFLDKTDLEFELNKTSNSPWDSPLGMFSWW